MRNVSRPDGRNENRRVLILGAGSDMAMALARGSAATQALTLRGSVAKPAPPVAAGRSSQSRL